MLATLRIKNLALAEDLTIEWRPGFNVVTGETGAGKSILIGALSLALGERADRDAIRSGADRLTVEATFELGEEIEPMDEFLEEWGMEPCEDGRLLLKRTLVRTGTNKQYVNGSATTLANLSRLGDLLVDIHGPHDHQSLFHAARQLEILDAFAGLEGLRRAYTDLHRERDEATARLRELAGGDPEEQARQVDLWRFQFQEIEDAGLETEEEETLDREYQKASNAAHLLQLAQGACELLEGDEGSASEPLSQAGRILEEMRSLDPDLESVVDQHRQIVALTRDLASEARGYVDQIDLDPERLHELERRYALLQSLKRKYGATIGDILRFQRDLAEKIDGMQSMEAELTRLEGHVERLEEQLLGAGKELSAKRRAAIPKLSTKVTEQLRDLGFSQSQFEVAMDSVASLAQGTSRGLDTVDFQFGPNPGEPSKPLKAIASSGEMARVMLAIKTALAAEDSVHLMVFDEVDANVGGETAKVVGEKMREIGAQRQTLCITHLPTVAASGDAHFVVRKRVVDGRSISEIECLEHDGRVEELTRMLGGASDAARHHAQALVSGDG